MDNQIKKVSLPLDVKNIINILYENDYEAFAVGGCVRDSLIGKEPMDWDITTSATPEAAKKLFLGKGYKVVETGMKHGTITLVINKNSYEVTTYRVEEDYLDNRRPSQVWFTTSLEQDLSRRDFTINGLAYNDMIGLVDYYNGIEDLKRGIIRTIGNANDRFNEDGLRILRAVRFSTVLNFTMEKETYISIKNNYSLLSNISMERIRDEFIKIILSEKPSKGIKSLCELMLMNYIIPELNYLGGTNNMADWKPNDFFYNKIRILDEVENSLSLRLAALLYDIESNSKIQTRDDITEQELVNKFIIENILRKMKFENSIIKKTCILAKYCIKDINYSSKENMKRLIIEIGEDNLEDVFNLSYVILKNVHKDINKAQEIILLKKQCNDIIKNGEPLYIKDLKINGEDLKSLGFQNGKLIGDTLRYLLDEVLKDPKENKRENLVLLTKKYCKY